MSDLNIYICPSCFGVIGRDCWNPVDCMDVKRQMEMDRDREAGVELESLQSELSTLRTLLRERDEARERAEHEANNVTNLHLQVNEARTKALDDAVLEVKVWIDFWETHYDIQSGQQLVDARQALKDTQT